MKKLAVVLFMFFLLMSKMNTERHFSLRDYVDGEYTVYTNVAVNTSSINLGSCYMTKTNSRIDKSILGEDMKVMNIEIMALLKELNAEIINYDYLEEAVVISAYSPKIDEYIKVKDRKSNLQIAVYTDYSIIGWPTILGSF